MYALIVVYCFNLTVITETNTNSLQANHKREMKDVAKNRFSLVAIQDVNWLEIDNWSSG